MENISVFGDSLLKGVALNPKKNKYYIIKNNAMEIFSKVFDAKINNFSKFGCTTTKALTVIKKYANKLTQNNKVIIELGGNDSDYFWNEISDKPYDKHFPKTLIDDFKEKILNIIAILNSRKSEIILTTLPPVISKKYLEFVSKFPNVKKENIMIWLKEEDAIYRHQELYSNEIKEIADKNNIKLIDIRKEFLKIKDLENYFCLDGIHLNEKGHEFLGNIFCKNLKNSYMPKKIYKGA